MNDHQNTMPTRSRNPVAAVLLSVAATGLGHIYCGRMLKGLILFFASFAFAPVIVAAARSAASGFSLALVIGSLLLMLVIFIYAVVDAGLLARRLNNNYVLKEYNRWPIYLIFIVVSVSYPVNLAYSIRDHVVQTFKIPSASMAPSILPGDYIFLNKAIYKIQPIQRGDVVVFPNPNDRRFFFMKRIVALPGDSVEIRDNILYINDKPLPHLPVDPLPEMNVPLSPGGRVVTEVNGSSRYPIIISADQPDNRSKTIVPHGMCYVLSDNRLTNLSGRPKATHHKPKLGDSRYYGPIPLADVKGRLDYICWPAVTWARFGAYDH